MNNLNPVAKVEYSEERKDYTVYLDYGNIVDRPITMGICIAGDGKRSLKLVNRLVMAINDGVVCSNPRITKDVYGKTYVTGTINVMGKYLNRDLERLGY